MCGALRVTKLHVFFDKSVLEVFINDGRRTVTKAVYPDSGVRGVKPFADPTGAEVMSLDAWELKSI